MSKIDRLVAERVMGLRISEGTECGVCWGRGEYSKCGVGREGRRTRPTMQPCSTCRGSGRRDVVRPCAYSTNIEAAWEVVEHLRKQTKDDGTRKYLVSVVDHDDGKMECVIQPGRLWTMSSCANHESAPMAICLAALRAVGVPESEIQEAMR